MFVHGPDFSDISRKAVFSDTGTIILENTHKTHFYKCTKGISVSRQEQRWPADSPDCTWLTSDLGAKQDRDAQYLYGTCRASLLP